MAPPRPPAHPSGVELSSYLTQLDAWVRDTDRKMQMALAVAAAMQGQPAPATISVPHNDSWLDNDNVDGTHPFNLRYVISANVQRVVSARLSIHLAPYRTYNTNSGLNTGIESANHSHVEAAHTHEMFTTASGSPGNTPVTWTDANGAIWGVTAPMVFGGTINTFSTSPGSTSGQSADHTHPLNLSQTLGVTEGAVASGVTIAFDGTDQTAALGGPFNADQIELNVLPYLPATKNAWHTIALQPSGLGRIEAHLRLGVYVAAGTVF